MKYSGFFGNSLYDFLKPGPLGEGNMRWMKPGVDFTKYKKFMVDSIVFFFADDSEYKGIDAEKAKEPAGGFNK
jgi:hypothetical protein